MKKSVFIYLALFVLCLTLGQSCQRKSTSEGNAVYYWRTTFHLDSYEKEFLAKHNVTKMYLKFFDVVCDWNDVASPTGTLVFNDSIPEGVEIVPTVFISSEAINSYPKYMQKLLLRICTMAEVNGVSFNEIQIDCDWTESGRDSYFAFMEEFRELLKTKNIKLSTTIRLFQLNDKAPAADYGVLMCYNTGDIQTWGTENSIINIDDIKPYTQALHRYSLPLSVAFPTYSWDLAFNYEMEFIGINYSSVDFSDTKSIKKIGDNRYKVVKPDDYKFRWYEKCYYRRENSPIKVIIEAKSLVEENISHPTSQTVIYDLDSENLKNYSENEIDKIYR